MLTLSAPLPDPRVEAQAAADQVIAACRQGAQIELPEFLEWLADRLVYLCAENPNADFILSARERAARLRKALTAYDAANRHG